MMPMTTIAVTMPTTNPIAIPVDIPPKKKKWISVLSKQIRYFAYLIAKNSYLLCQEDVNLENTVCN